MYFFPFNMSEDESSGTDSETDSGYSDHLGSGQAFWGLDCWNVIHHDHNEDLSTIAYGSDVDSRFGDGNSEVTETFHSGHFCRDRRRQ